MRERLVKVVRVYNERLVTSGDEDAGYPPAAALATAPAALSTAPAAACAPSATLPAASVTPSLTAPAASPTALPTVDAAPLIASPTSPKKERRCERRERRAGPEVAAGASCVREAPEMLK